MTTHPEIRRQLVWNIEHERRERRYRRWGLVLFIGLSVGAMYGVWRMFR